MRHREIGPSGNNDVEITVYPPDEPLPEGLHAIEELTDADIETIEDSEQPQPIEADPAERMPPSAEPIGAEEIEKVRRIAMEAFEAIPKGEREASPLDQNAPVSEKTRRPTAEVPMSERYLSLVKQHEVAQNNFQEAQREADALAVARANSMWKRMFGGGEVRKARENAERFRATLLSTEARLGEAKRREEIYGQTKEMSDFERGMRANQNDGRLEAPLTATEQAQLSLARQVERNEARLSELDRQMDDAARRIEAAKGEENAYPVMTRIFGNRALRQAERDFESARRERVAVQAKKEVARHHLSKLERESDEAKRAANPPEQAAA
jgi:hypothetical protein